MYEIWKVIYGQVLDNDDQKKLQEQLGNEELSEWITENRYGAVEYSGAGDTIPMYLGVELASFDSSGHGMEMSELRTTPTEKEIAKVEKIRQDVAKVFKLTPSAELFWSTS
jgi:hypothetical protein